MTHIAYTKILKRLAWAYAGIMFATREEQFLKSLCSLPEVKNKKYFESYYIQKFFSFSVIFFEYIELIYGAYLLKDRPSFEWVAKCCGRVILYRLVVFMLIVLVFFQSVLRLWSNTKSKTWNTDKIGILYLYPPWNRWDGEANGLKQQLSHSRKYGSSGKRVKELQLKLSYSVL